MEASGHGCSSEWDPEEGFGNDEEWSEGEDES